MYLLHKGILGIFPVIVIKLISCNRNRNLEQINVRLCFLRSLAFVHCRKENNELYEYDSCWCCKFYQCSNDIVGQWVTGNTCLPFWYMFITHCTLISRMSGLFLSASSTRTLSVVLALVGKAGAAMAFTDIYIYTSELVPTEVRNIGIGTASFCARISGMAAPYVGGILVRNIPLWLNVN